MKNKILEFLKNKRNLIVLIVALVLLIAGATIGIVACNKKTDLTDDTNVASVDTEKVEPTEVVETETADTETEVTEATEVVENTETEVASNETSTEKNATTNNKKNNTSNNNSNTNNSSNSNGACQHEYGGYSFSIDCIQEETYEEVNTVIEPEKTIWSVNWDGYTYNFNSYEEASDFCDGYSLNKNTITQETIPAVIHTGRKQITPRITQQHIVRYCSKCGEIYEEEWGDKYVYGP